MQAELATILQVECFVFQGLTANKSKADTGLAVVLTIAMEHRCDHALDGHLQAVSVELANPPGTDAVRSSFTDFRGGVHELKLPSSPRVPIEGNRHRVRRPGPAPRANTRPRSP